MPMYYFHLSDDHRVLDPDGTDLVDLAAARTHAFGVARELTFKSQGMLDENWSRWRMLIHDDGGVELFSLELSDFETGD
jgi:hypothetical protein